MKRRVAKASILALFPLLLLSGLGLTGPMHGTYEGCPIVKVVVDGKEIQSDVPAILFKNRTMVPIRFVSEALGALVTWDEDNFTAEITSQSESELVAKLKTENDELKAQLEAAREIVAKLTAPKTQQVAVIAPSLSTAAKARSIMQSLKLTEVSPKDADIILVVVRSLLYYPLSPSYDSYRDLQRDAENQLNISGPTYHIYFYEHLGDLTIRELKHISEPAE